MTMGDYEDCVEVEEEEIEASVRERAFDVGSGEVELEDVDGEEDDFTGDREALVNLLIEINENQPVDLDLGQGPEDGEEVEEEEIEPMSKARDPSNDLIFSDSMRDRAGLIGDDEWEEVEPGGEDDGE